MSRVGPVIPRSNSSKLRVSPCVGDDSGEVGGGVRGASVRTHGRSLRACGPMRGRKHFEGWSRGPIYGKYVEGVIPLRVRHDAVGRRGGGSARYSPLAGFLSDTSPADVAWWVPTVRQAGAI